LLCFELAIVAVLHLFAFSPKVYHTNEVATYPLTADSIDEIGPKQGGFLGVKAILDAINPWDIVKGFARSIRWLFVGAKNRENDISYKSDIRDFSNPSNENDFTLESQGTDPGYKGAQGLPIADQFRRSKFGMPSSNKVDDKGAGLIAHIQPNPLSPSSGYIPARQRYDANGQDISQSGNQYYPLNRGSPADSYQEKLRQARRNNPNPLQQWANASAAKVGSIEGGLST
jgi:hypothetical protein